MEKAPGSIPVTAGRRNRTFGPSKLGFNGAVRQNFSWKIDSFRVFSVGEIYGPKGGSRRFLRQPHHVPAWPDLIMGQPTCRASPILIQTPIEMSFQSRSYDRKFSATFATRLFPFEVVFGSVHGDLQKVSVETDSCESESNSNKSLFCVLVNFQLIPTH